MGKLRYLMSMPDVPVYGTFLDGKDIYQETLTSNGLIVMGNEGKGIRQETAEPNTWLPEFTNISSSALGVNNSRESCPCPWHKHKSQPRENMQKRRPCHEQSLRP